MTPLLFLAGSTGPLELLVILAAILVLFGPRRLPEIARSIGRMLHELRKASDDFRSQVMSIEDTITSAGTQTGASSAKPPLLESAREDARPPDVRMTPVSIMEGERPREPIGGDASALEETDVGSAS